MSEMEYQQANDEVTKMVHDKFACRPHGKGYVVTEEQAAFLATAERRFDELRKDRDSKMHENLMLQDKLRDYEMASTRMQLLHAIPPVIVCLLWLVGAMEGLADPIFTGVAVVICGLWAAANWKWGKVNA